MATSILEGDRQFGLVVRYTPGYRDSIEKIRNIKVAYGTGNGTNAYLPLSELATITLDTGAAWIYHESVQRFIPVKFSVRGRDLGSTVEEAQQRIVKNVKLPPRIPFGLGRGVWRPSGSQEASRGHCPDQSRVVHRVALSSHAAGAGSEGLSAFRSGKCCQSP